MGLTVQRSSGLKPPTITPKITEASREKSSNEGGKGNNVAISTKVSPLTKILFPFFVSTLLFFTGKNNTNSPQGPITSPSQTSKVTFQLNNIFPSSSSAQASQTTTPKAKKHLASSKPVSIRFIDNKETIVATFDLNAYKLSFIKAWDHVNRDESITSMASRTQADFIVNGGFFDTKKLEAVGIEKKACEIISWNTFRSFHRPIFYIDKNNKPNVFHPSSDKPLELYLLTSKGIKIPVDAVNSIPDKNNVVVINKYFNKDLPIKHNGLCIVVQNNQIVQIHNNIQGKVTIPRNGFLIFINHKALSKNEDLLQNAVNEEIVLKDNLPVDMVDGVTLGSTLVENGVINTNLEIYDPNIVSKKHSRTAYGFNNERNKFIIISSRRGRTLTELAYLCKKLGIKNAYSADGGTSNSLFMNLRNGNVIVRQGRPIVNALGLKKN